MREGCSGDRRPRRGACGGEASSAAAAEEEFGPVPLGGARAI